MRFLHFATGLLLLGLGTALLFLFIYMKAIGSVAIIEENIWVWGAEVGLWILCIILGTISAVNIAFNKGGNHEK